MYMIKKIDILERIVDIGVVAVIRANSTKEAIKISESCIEGGIPAIEVTFTVNDADKVIRELKDKFPNDKLIVGAGTVLDSETARVAILNGADRKEHTSELQSR